MESFGWEWHEFKQALRQLDREAFDELLNHARKHAAAGGHMANPNPFESVVMAILIEHEKTIQTLRAEGEQKGQQRIDDDDGENEM